MILRKTIKAGPAFNTRRGGTFAPYMSMSLTISLLSLFLTQARAEPGQIQVGSRLFHQYCFDCHGPKKDGMGGLRYLLEQEPANLNAQATQTKTEQELFSIIKYGGGVEMHGWADTFTDEQILDLVRYIRNPPE